MGSIMRRLNIEASLGRPSICPTDQDPAIIPETGRLTLSYRRLNTSGRVQFRFGEVPRLSGAGPNLICFAKHHKPHTLSQDNSLGLPTSPFRKPGRTAVPLLL